MCQRYETVLLAKVPEIDLNDLFDTSIPRQFAPEYAQKAYWSLLEQERAVGDYFQGEGERVLEITPKDRRLMIIWLE